MLESEGVIRSDGSAIRVGERVIRTGKDFLCYLIL